MHSSCNEGGIENIPRGFVQVGLKAWCWISLFLVCVTCENQIIVNENG